MNVLGNACDDEDAQIFKNEELPRIKTSIAAEVTSVSPPKSPPFRSRQPKVDLQILSCHPQSNSRDFDSPLQESHSEHREMSDPSAGSGHDDAAVTTEALRATSDAAPTAGVSKMSSLGMGSELHETAVAALAVQRSQTVRRIDSKNNSEEAVPQVAPMKRKDLKVQTADPSSANASAAPPDESLTTSPTLQKHMIDNPHPESNENNLPLVQPGSPIGDGSMQSPRKNSGPLPPLSELVASVAAQETRAPPNAHQHQPSFSSATSQSPRVSFHPPFPGSAQTSPISFAPSSTTARSPVSTLGDISHYPSPYAQQPSYHSYYTERRPGTAADGSRGFTPNVPSLPSGSSSESHGDTVSTAQTTPIDSSAAPPPPPPPLDGTHRPILPPPAAMINANVIGSFKCDFDGCNAPPFSTQYLLSSHKNVHSSSRPHYCPVPNCSRAEGGKGFKRKNEMIRHGLVHNSPGYVCPFCKDRDHRYPRPDNLQRHVRVHHVDKDKDDPALREVLGQRPEGAIQKQRRRRAQSATTADLPALPPPPAS